MTTREVVGVLWCVVLMTACIVGMLLALL